MTAKLIDEIYNAILLAGLEGGDEHDDITINIASLHYILSTHIPSLDTEKLDIAIQRIRKYAETTQIGYGVFWDNVLEILEDELYQSLTVDYNMVDRLIRKREGTGDIDTGYVIEKFIEDLQSLKSQQSGDSIPAVEEDFMQVASGKKTFEELEDQPVEPVDRDTLIEQIECMQVELDFLKNKKPVEPVEQGCNHERYGTNAGYTDGSIVLKCRKCGETEPVEQVAKVNKNKNGDYTCGYCDCIDIEDYTCYCPMCGRKLSRK